MKFTKVLLMCDGDGEDTGGNEGGPVIPPTKP